jgi:hypothetical protein
MGEDWHVRTHLGLAAALAASVLLLSACSTPAHLPPQPTSLDARIYSGSILLLHQAANESLLNLGQPDPQPTHYLLFDESAWGVGMSACLRKQGYVDYTGTDGGSMTWVSGEKTDTGPRRLGWYECASAQSSPTTEFGLLSKSERSYLYRYYLKWLVPCLELNGYHVVSPPGRSQFVQDPLQSGWWNPYFAVSKPVSRVEINRLMTACPSSPTGLTINHE